MEKILTNPDGSKTVHLDAPLVTHAGERKSVTLRAPTYGDFFALGDPTATIISARSAFEQDDMVVLQSYVERLADVDGAALAQIRSLTDALALVKAVKDFFRAASARLSTASPTPSSSISAGPSTPSAD